MAEIRVRELRTEEIVPGSPVVVLPVALCATPVPGSVQHPCDRCGRMCWLAPASQRVLIEIDLATVCLLCAGGLAVRDGEVLVMSGGLRELDDPRGR